MPKRINQGRIAQRRRDSDSEEYYDRAPFLDGLMNDTPVRWRRLRRGSPNIQVKKKDRITSYGDIEGQQINYQWYDESATLDPQTLSDHEQRIRDALLYGTGAIQANGVLSKDTVKKGLDALANNKPTPWKHWTSVQVPTSWPVEKVYPIEWTKADQTAAHNDGWGVVTSWKPHVSSHTDRMTNKQATLRVGRMAANGNKLCRKALAYIAMRAIEDGGPID